MYLKLERLLDLFSKNLLYNMYNFKNCTPIYYFKIIRKYNFHILYFIIRFENGRFGLDNGLKYVKNVKF